MKRLQRILQIIRNYGAGFILFRIWYLLERKSGRQKRKFPMRLWNNIRLEEYVQGEPAAMLTRPRGFFFTPGQLPPINPAWHNDIIANAEDILNNRFYYFFHNSYSLGADIDWFSNPVTGKHANAAKHWTELQDFDPELGDIKYIWEPSRFAWAYILVRAFAATGDNKYPEKFWQLFEDWLQKNQPNQGPNYYCGQECSIRLMAICFAGFAFYNAPVSTDERKLKLFKSIAVLAERIDKNISYAISTRTNHALTEATGIYTAGLLFPECKKARRWLRRGKKILVREGLKQIFADGSYIQHSINYHRLMIQTVTWAIRLGQINNIKFPDAFLRKVKLAVEFLYQLQDPATGRLPNYGSNDGSIIIPLNSCNYLDYRPVIQAGHYLVNGEKLYSAGPWDEDLLWLFGEKALANIAVNNPYINRDFDYGGYYTLRGQQSWGMIRCHSFKTRPGQTDGLHLDVWWKGINIIRDSGSYLYNTEPLWKLYFVETAAHNTIVVDGENQMSRGERFITYDWLQASRGVTGVVNGNRCFSGAHYGFKRLGDDIVHYRSVILVDELNTWIVVDDITGHGRHKVNLYWHLYDCVEKIDGKSVLLNCNGDKAMLTLLAPDGVKLQHHSGNDQIPAGYNSLYYGEKTPAPVIVVPVEQELPLRFISVISLGNSVFAGLEKNSIILESADKNKKIIPIDSKPSVDKTVFHIS